MTINPIDDISRLRNLKYRQGIRDAEDRFPMSKIKLEMSGGETWIHIPEAKILIVEPKILIRNLKYRQGIRDAEDRLEMWSQISISLTNEKNE
jgi:hypothetical protein